MVVAVVVVVEVVVVAIRVVAVVVVVPVASVVVVAVVVVVLVVVLAVVVAICLSLCLSIYLSVYLSIFLLYLSIYLPIYLFSYLAICLCARLKTKLFCETSAIFEVENIQNGANLRDFFNFGGSQHHTTSKTKQFCETPFKNGKLSAELTAMYQCVLRFFHSTCLKYCACHEKVTCIFANLPQMPLRLPTFLNLLQNPHVLHIFGKVQNPLRLPRKTASPKMVWAWKNGLSMKKWSEHVAFLPCLHPKMFRAQWRALFEHLNFQKWSEPDSFRHFWLRNVLRATTLWTFSTSQFPKWSEHEVLLVFWLRNLLCTTMACNFWSPFDQIALHPPR